MSVKKHIELDTEEIKGVKEFNIIRAGVPHFYKWGRNVRLFLPKPRLS